MGRLSLRLLMRGTCSKMDLRSKTFIANIEQTLRVCCPGEICYDKKYLTYRALTH